MSISVAPSRSQRSAGEPLGDKISLHHAAISDSQLLSPNTARGNKRHFSATHRSAVATRSGSKPSTSTNTFSSSVESSGSSTDGKARSEMVAQAITWLYDYDGGEEDDDWLHNPGKSSPSPPCSHRCNTCLSRRGVVNVATLFLLLSAVLMLFAGYPLLSVLLVTPRSKISTGWALGGTNGTGQIPLFANPNFAQLIDKDTPSKDYAWTNPRDSSAYHLVFSDEFEQDGRTFWPGDDPFWEAVDLHYWVTGDYEWYSPEAINTTNGYLSIWMERKETHNLHFQSGMLQSWNKFCFQGGYVETSVILPGSHDTQGFWPAVWMMGNLGRAGYAGSTQGMWPYSYTSCDVGTLANQTNAAKTAPLAALQAHGLYSSDVDHKLSFLEGQRTSACTCSDEDHPGPNVRVGRSAPELDILEAQVLNGQGEASQSLQIAPFDADYAWDQTAKGATLHQTTSAFNSYTGGVYQEAVSGVSPIPSTAYDQSGGTPVRFGVEYAPDWNADGSGHVTWFIDGVPRWTLSGKALGPNPLTEIGQRLIPTEPLSIILNLAISDGFQHVDVPNLPLPAKLSVDYVRVYQRDDGPDRISCDPADHPTAKYIHDHLDIYTNPNYTTFPQDVYAWPRNSLIDQC